MGKHGGHHRGYRGNYGPGTNYDPGMGRGPEGYDGRPRLSRKVTMGFVLVGLVVWSLVAWAGYALVDPVLGWVAASAGLVLDSGKTVATAAGAGKEVGTAIDSLNSSGLLGQIIALLRIVLKPAIVIVWAIGALILFVAPAILQKIGGLLATRRH